MITAPNWKKKTPRDPKFLRWLSTRRCELEYGRHGGCFGDVVGHHTEPGGTSLKGSDYSAISLCVAHHKLMDAAGKKGCGIWTEDELAEIISRNVADYRAKGGTVRG